MYIFSLARSLGSSLPVLDYVKKLQVGKRLLRQKMHSVFAPEAVCFDVKSGSNFQVCGSVVHSFSIKGLKLRFNANLWHTSVRCTVRSLNSLCLIDGKPRYGPLNA